MIAETCPSCGLIVTAIAHDCLKALVKLVARLDAEIGDLREQLQGLDDEVVGVEVEVDLTNQRLSAIESELE